MREWKMRHGQKCKGGKCRSSLAVDGQLNLECKERQRQVTSWKQCFNCFELYNIGGLCCVYWYIAVIHT